MAHVEQSSVPLQLVSPHVGTTQAPQSVAQLSQSSGASHEASPQPVPATQSPQSVTQLEQSSVGLSQTASPQPTNGHSPQSVSQLEQSSPVSQIASPHPATA
jgi:hypothetical protein